MLLKTSDKVKKKHLGLKLGCYVLNVLSCWFWKKGAGWSHYLVGIQRTVLNTDLGRTQLVLM